MWNVPTCCLFIADDKHLVFLTQHVKGRNQFINAVYMPVCGNESSHKNEQMLRQKKMSCLSVCYFTANILDWVWQTEIRPPHTHTRLRACTLTHTHKHKRTHARAHEWNKRSCESFHLIVRKKERGVIQHDVFFFRLFLKDAIDI